MKIVHVTRALIVNSGVSVFVSRMAGAMARLGHTVSIRYTWKPDLSVDKEVDLKQFNTLEELSFRPDIVHIHGLWSFDMVRAMVWCRRNKIRYFVSPHGGLMPRVMRKGRLKKRLFYWLFLHKNLNIASGIHCTGKGEVEAVKSLNIKAHTFIVPLGCDLPCLQQNQKKEKNILFLSRLSEEKGLVYLLDAWKSIKHNGWHLILAGPDWRGYKSILEKKIQEDRIRDVIFWGQADTTDKDVLYRKSSLFVLPSPMENFSMVVLDALAYGLPVICTVGCPWEVIRNENCGWWVESSSSIALAVAMEEGLGKTPQDILSMGARAVNVARRFSWDRLASILLDEYR